MNHFTEEEITFILKSVDQVTNFYSLHLTFIKVNLGLGLQPVAFPQVSFESGGALI